MTRLDVSTARELLQRLGRATSNVTDTVRAEGLAQCRRAISEGKAQGRTRADVLRDFISAHDVVFGMSPGEGLYPHPRECRADDRRVEEPVGPAEDRLCPGPVSERSI